MPIALVLCDSCHDGEQILLTRQQTHSAYEILFDTRTTLRSSPLVRVELAPLFQCKSRREMSQRTTEARQVNANGCRRAHRSVVGLKFNHYCFSPNPNPNKNNNNNNKVSIPFSMRKLVASASASVLARLISPTSAIELESLIGCLQSLFEERSRSAGAHTRTNTTQGLTSGSSSCKLVGAPLQRVRERPLARFRCGNCRECRANRNAQPPSTAAAATTTTTSNGAAPFTGFGFCGHVAWESEWDQCHAGGSRDLHAINIEPRS